ncbi:HEPN domain-containing protein [Methylobacterium aerolatum]|uniref:HEPN domain-containing protein/predicted nucleotidyltransferase n=1 Tax=Methylobacterium aerolatum TaxID=418708 RepID=A0ABU0I4B3_9HYPH|nr:HEPN domain-containing protein [Methylobacterium aerolatum]MDQ0448526.1 HEPN domain-containing protein/predicted nucleotidyltransferase [Methylobacterium aerolatum]GJD33143.1 hypothetical protein FMGBMHLM_0028 [Methylobacterium aerolatum]
MLDDATIAPIPLRFRRHLVRALKILFEEFEEAQKGKLADKAERGRILKVILYGSFARGTWREDHGSGFVSDFDLLVIVNSERFAREYEAWEWANERFVQEALLRDTPRPTPSFVVHSYADVNDQLSRGRPFFADIAREGLVLYEVPGFPLSEIGPFSDEVRREEEWLHYDEWYPDGAYRIKATRNAMDAERLKAAAFDLHQATEYLYHCFLLVQTLYSPKLHSLRELRKKAENIDYRLVEAWPRTTRLARRRFQLLHDAYVKARYSYKYEITAEELSWLIERVEVLSRLVADICAERLGERPEGRRSVNGEP